MKHERIMNQKKFMLKVPEVSFPITVVTPKLKHDNFIRKNQLKYHQVANWLPTKYDPLDLYLTVEEEDQEHTYSKFRKWIIGRNI